MTGHRGAKVRRGAIAALAVGALSTGPAWAAGGDPSPSPTPSSTETLPVAVTLARVAPLAPQPGDTLTVRGSLANQTDSPVTNLSLRLAVSPTKVGSRGQFDEYATTVDGAAPVDAQAPSTETSTLGRTDLEPGAAEDFAISVPVNDLTLPEAWQVYEMAVVVTGDTVVGTTTVGQLRTFLPWAPLGVPGVGLPTKVAWVWPLIDRPHRSDGTTWIDNDLAASFATGGRLDRLLAAGAAAQSQEPPTPPPSPTKRRHHRRSSQPRQAPQPRPTVQPVPLTWAIDPELVDAAVAMKSGYTIPTDSGRKPGDGGPPAKAWLDALKQALQGGEMFAVPYADPDVTAASQYGLGSEVQAGITAGADLLKQELDRRPLAYAWPPNGVADLRTLDTLFAARETTVVLDASTLPVTGGDTSLTPGAHTIISSRDGPFDALLADDGLNQVVDDGAQTAAAGPLAVQRLLSELLMVQAERPSDQRSLVITPNRRWAPTAAYANALVADTGKVPWIDPVSLPDVADGPLDDTVQRGPLSYSPTDRVLQLPRSYVVSVRRIKHLVDAFVAIVPPGDKTASGFDDGILRLLSSAWRGDPSTAHVVRDQLAQKVQRTMGLVRIASKQGSLITLTSHTGIVPVTVTNNLDTPVRVIVEVEPDQHLVVKNDQVVQTVAAHRQAPVDVHATAQTSGVFRLTVRLRTPGIPSFHYGPPVPLRIRSTAYGATALLITGGATAVLLLTVVIRLVRRARSARRTLVTTT